MAQLRLNRAKGCEGIALPFYIQTLRAILTKTRKDGYKPHNYSDEANCQIQLLLDTKSGKISMQIVV